MSLKLVLEMEASEQITGNEDEVQAAQTATEVESASAELAEVGGEAEEYSEGIDASVDAAGELDEVHDTLAASVENGEGVSEETAKMAEIAVEAICAKVGISAREARLMPAMESFGSANSRLTATKLAMEGIKETAIRIWEAIKKAAIHVWNVIKSFVAGLFKSRTMLEKHLKNLKERTAKASGTPKSKTISSGAKAFTIDGKANQENVLTVLLESSQLPIIANLFTDKASQIAKGAVEGKDAKAAFIDWMEKSKSKRRAAGDNKTAAGYFVNGRSIVTTTFAEADKLPQIAIETLEKNFAKDIDAPTKDQINNVIDKALETLKALTEFDKISKNLEKITKEITSHADKMIKLQASVQDAKATEKGTIKSDADKSADTVRAVNGMISKVGVAFPSMMFAAVKAAADYANSGLNNLEAEKKDSK